MTKQALVHVVVAAAMVVSGCSSRSAGHGVWQVRFGPILGNELIVGRVVSQSQAWILTGGNALVHVDLQDGGQRRSPVAPLGADEHVWGLASTGDGTFWTLASRTMLAQLSEDGRVVRRVALSQPHVGVFAAGSELLLQVMDFQPPADALTAGLPGAAARHRWGAMRTRALPLSRASVAALNLVSCGATATSAIPCWFPDQAAITLTDSSGGSRELQLEGLPIVAPEVLLASDNPRRPIRDAVVSSDGTIWVLGSGAPPVSDASGRPGGWLLNRYGSDGRLQGRLQLPEPARLLLHVRNGGCWLIAWDGRVVEVRP